MNELFYKSIDSAFEQIAPWLLPCSAASSGVRTSLAIEELANLKVTLENFLGATNYAEGLKVQKIEEFYEEHGGKDSQRDELQALFISYGSDKATTHNYHLLYSCLFNPDEVGRVFEIGLGTNNLDVASNMGALGKPGASLRAFRDFFPRSDIFGADIDSRVLFAEDRIICFEVDQHKIESLEGLSSKIGQPEFDLMIDDGLHAPVANLNSLCFFANHIRRDGWIVIEDVPWMNLFFWRLIASRLSSRFDCRFLICKGLHMFVAKKNA
jgi:hypothetical protein